MKFHNFSSGIPDTISPEMCYLVGQESLAQLANLVELETDVPDEQLAILLRLTEGYCVVYQTLARPPAMAITRELVAK